MKTLYLVRHAKSYWDLDWLDDIERPLNPRGKRDAALMGRLLNSRGAVPDILLTSPAARAMSTARIVAAKLDYPAGRIRVDERLYESSPHRILEVLGELDSDVATAMLVGHNPEATTLANRLTEAGIDNVPTSGVVCIGLNIDSWRDVEKTVGRLLGFDTPKRVRALNADIPSERGRHPEI